MPQPWLGKLARGECRVAVPSWPATRRAGIARRLRQKPGETNDEHRVRHLRPNSVRSVREGLEPRFTDGEWRAFVSEIRAGEFDLHRPTPAEHADHTASARDAGRPTETAARTPSSHPAHAPKPKQWGVQRPWARRNAAEVGVLGAAPRDRGRSS